MDPPHYSPFEHQAKPMKTGDYIMPTDEWDTGTTHVDAYCKLWSGNFKGWIQHRQILHTTLGHKLMTVK
jgi:hypothetical protein